MQVVVAKQFPSNLRIKQHIVIWEIVELIYGFFYGIIANNIFRYHAVYLNKYQRRSSFHLEEMQISDVDQCLLCIALCDIVQKRSVMDNWKNNLKWSGSFRNAVHAMFMSLPCPGLHRSGAEFNWKSLFSLEMPSCFNNICWNLPSCGNTVSQAL